MMDINMQDPLEFKLDGMTIEEWRQEAIDRRKELIRHLEGEGVEMPAPYGHEFKIGDRVRINRRGFKRDNSDIPDSQNGVSWTRSMFKYDGHIGKIKSIHPQSGVVTTNTYKIGGGEDWHWIAEWLEHVK